MGADVLGGGGLLRTLLEMEGLGEGVWDLGGLSIYLRRRDPSN